MGLVRPHARRVCVALALTTAFACSGAVERPNVVLVISDDADYEQLGFSGYPAARTPTLDSLAEAGAVFPVAHSSARCRPALAMLLSGRYPHQNGVYFNRGVETLDPAGSLPALLRSAGYATFCGGKYWEGDPEAMGFDAPAEPSRDFARKGQADLFRFLDENAGERPFFVWWAPAIPHMPHDAPGVFVDAVEVDAIPIPEWFDGDSEVLRTFERDLIAMVHWFDAELARLVEKLEELDERDDTLFVFLIDNGYSNGLISKGSPFEKGVRTPAVLCWPGRVPVTERSELVAAVDLFETILAYAGLPGTDGPGRSLVPLLEGRSYLPRGALHGAVYPRWASEPADPAGDVLALYRREARWKYVLFVDEVPATMWEITRATPLGRHERRRGEENLYDLESDPYELQDLSSDPAQRARMEAMRQATLDWWRRTGGGELDLP